MAERKSFLLRLDAKTYEELRRWADAELRSVNAQIDFILRRAIQKRKGGKEEGGRGGSASP